MKTKFVKLEGVGEEAGPFYINPKHVVLVALDEEGTTNVVLHNGNPIAVNSSLEDTITLLKGDEVL